MGAGEGKDLSRNTLLSLVRCVNWTFPLSFISWAGAMGAGGGQRFIQEHIVVTCEVRELNISVIFH